MPHTNKSKHFRYCLLFPRLLNVDLIKDPGSIANFFAAQESFSAMIVAYRNDTLRYKTNFGLKVSFITKQFGHVIDGIIFLFKQSANIDLLHLFQLNRLNSILWLIVYKIINPDGFVYVKMDADDNAVKWMGGQRSFKSELKWLILRRIFKRYINLLSLETTSALALFKNKFPELAQKSILIPNGVSQWHATPNKTKRQIMTFVGRVGAYQKGLDILLDAWMQANTDGWELQLIGELECEGPRSQSITAQRLNNIHKGIIWRGNITDRKTLSSLVCDSSVFVFPSRWESFGISLVEAALSGCYLLTSPVGCAHDLLMRYQYGSIVTNNSVIEWTQSIDFVINNWAIIKNQQRDIASVQQFYSYDINCNAILQRFYSYRALKWTP